jgi:hypothetical protein
VVLERCTCEPWVSGVVDWDKAGGEGHLDGDTPGTVVRHDWPCCERPVEFNGNPLALIFPAINLQCISFLLVFTCKNVPIHIVVSRVSFVNPPPLMVCAAYSFLVAMLAVLYSAYSLCSRVGNPQALPRIP